MCSPAEGDVEDGEVLPGPAVLLEGRAHARGHDRAVHLHSAFRSRLRGGIAFRALSQARFRLCTH